MLFIIVKRWRYIVMEQNHGTKWIFRYDLVFFINYMFFIEKNITGEISTFAEVSKNITKQ